MATQRDYYEILGVAKSAAPEEIKKAYRKAAAANHPDRNPGDAEAVERFKAAAEAFDVLGDTEKRALYDRYGHDAFSRGGRQPGFNDVNDIFGAFGDIFGNLFGGTPRGGGSRAMRGDSLRCGIRLDLKQAAFGCTQVVEIDRNELCATCDGSGAKPGSKAEKCAYCGGRGQKIQSQGFFSMQITCPACRGAGEIVRDKCSKCSGSGRESKRIKLDVKVPAGVDNGMQLCLRGEGEPGDRGGPRGDLFCDIEVAEHPLFQRHGQDLVCTVPLSFPQAALGTELDVPLLDGRHHLVIAAGTQAGDIVRLRGKGMPDPHSRRRGDLLVQIVVEVPRNISPRQEELLRELAEIEKKDVSAHQKSFIEKIKDYFATDESADKQP
ncbi:MAG: molecular chaperone DnaJ [Planctomycetia bacterium]|nr:molecular chaperone DnaJ [Planctomycetia bacterium]